MKMIPNNIGVAVARGILQTKKNSPHIFFGVGLVGVIGGAVLACRATLKLEQNLDEIKSDFHEVKELTKTKNYTEQDYYRDLGYVGTKSALKIAKLYGPAIVVGGVSIFALTGSHIQLTKRNAALTFTLAAVSKAYEEYRDRVRDEVGEEKERKLYHSITEEKLMIDDKSMLVEVADSSNLSPYARFFDEASPNWKKDSEFNKVFLMCQENYANHQLKSRGHVFLNDVYDSLGLERSQAGAVVGWILNGSGDNYISFGLFADGNERFVNGLEPRIILDFNVDGIVFDQI